MPADLRDLFEFGPFALDAEDGSLKRAGEVVPLPHRGADLLIVLLEEPGRVFSRTELISRAWDASVSDGSLDYQIHEIRKALAPDGARLVQNVPRRGFRFTGTVRRVRRQNHLLSETVVAAQPPAATVPTPAAIGPQRSAFRRLSLSLVGMLVMVIALVAGFRSTGSETLRIVESRALTHDGPPGLSAPLLTDGSRVYYIRLPDFKLWAVPVSGGAAAVVFDAASRFHLADPGNGSEYLAIKLDSASAVGEVWVVPTGSGVPRRIGNLSATEAAWSPDRRRIALVAEGKLSLANSDGGNLTGITLPDKNNANYPRWSPDGSTVRFTVHGPSDGTLPPVTLWEVGRNGGEARPVLRGWDPTLGDACHGVWTPDGRHFVFQVNRSDGRMDLWVMTEPRGIRAWLGASATMTPLTSGPLSLTAPAVSPDGRTLFATGALYQGQLVRWDQQSREFIPYLGGISATWISFSPDRQSIAYVGYPDRTLWRSRVDGSERRALAGGNFELDAVMWSPDGRWISFRSRMAGRRMKIFIIPSEGGQALPITSDDVDQGVASWSPDGRRIVFGDVPPQFGVPQGTEVLHVYDVVEKSSADVPGSQGLWTGRWSPDGRYISALTIDKEQRLKLFDTTTRRWRTTSAVHVNNPNWSHDSQFVFYDTEGGIKALRRLRIESDEVVDLTNLDVMTPVYGWSGLSPDGSPLILKNLTSPAVYALTIERR
jgi:Tol biopolymer transport system component/DNA-binding winged helix-turn-helix (wHTH) protein